MEQDGQGMSLDRLAIALTDRSLFVLDGLVFSYLSGLGKRRM